MKQRTNEKALDASLRMQYNTSMKTFFLLLCVHALTDFQLQNGAMHIRKRRDQADHWYYWQTAHALICAGGVYVVTTSLFLAITEFVAHWIIDFAKSDKKISLHRDQLCHLLCRVIYAFAV